MDALACMQPLLDRIIVKRVPPPEEQVTPGGIVLPQDVDTESRQHGHVVAVGPGRLDGDTPRPPLPQVGDKVMFTKESGTEVKINGTECLILQERDILAKIED